jgi:hypothetical protein
MSQPARVPAVVGTVAPVTPVLGRGRDGTANYTVRGRNVLHAK